MGRAPFAPATRPIIDRGKFGRRVDDAEPRCACGEPGPLDAETGDCVACYRVRSIVSELLAGRGALTYVPKPPPASAPRDELAVARERRDGAPIAIETRADDGAVVLDVDLGKPPEPRRT